MLDVARYCRVGIGTISAYRKRGQMPEGKKIGRTWTWPPEEIIAWQLNRERAGIGGRPKQEPTLDTPTCWVGDCPRRARYRITRAHPELTSELDSCRTHLGKAIALKVAFPGEPGFHPDEPAVEVRALIGSDEVLLTPDPPPLRATQSP
jgi:predicted DNA-binding transcriptional regulator AlpA